MKTEELKVLRMRLKSGEYDGTDIMQAWTAIDELIELRKKVEGLDGVCDCSCCKQVDSLDV